MWHNKQLGHYDTADRVAYMLPLHQLHENSRHMQSSRRHCNTPQLGPHWRKFHRQDEICLKKQGLKIPHDKSEKKYEDSIMYNYLSANSKGKDTLCWLLSNLSLLTCNIAIAWENNVEYKYVYCLT